MTKSHFRPYLALCLGGRLCPACQSIDNSAKNNIVSTSIDAIQGQIKLQAKRMASFSYKVPIWPYLSPCRYMQRDIATGLILQFAICSLGGHTQVMVAWEKQFIQHADNIQG